jgi:octaprenyl-diphosphate synthase
MANKLNSIRSPIEQELKTFEKHFRSALKSSVPILNVITYYVTRNRGKQIRPIFVFLSAKICGEVNDATFTAASMVELLHTASLIHDDVVDDALERRGKFSVNALWKKKVAVLVGDYMFAQGLLLSLENDEFHILKEMSHAVKALSEGELLQMEKARRLDIEESVYYDIIGKKTASLISAACKTGAVSVTDDKEVINRIGEMGMNIGIAFQIKDDLFDYGEKSIGKPVGIDIKEKKMTLPLIYALSQASKSEKRRIIRSVKYHGENNQRVREVIDFVKAKGGIEYATTAMEEYVEKSLSLLHSFPKSEARDALEQLIYYVIRREK